jgi:GNAT superfamily N-acetyltransferase
MESSMKTRLRRYIPYGDSREVSRFLERTYPPTDRNPNWLRARWEYMVYSGHGGQEEELEPIGIWEHEDEIVGVVNFEDFGEAYFQVHPGYARLKSEMLDHAEESLCTKECGKRRLTTYVNDFDTELERIASAAGYVKASGSPQVTARFDCTGALPPIVLPQGFRLTDRRECNDLRRINRVLWRGFNHEGPPPEKHVAGRADVEKAPLYRRDLVVMVEAPGGDLVSYCGIWYEAANRVAYVEPVATDPDYRRRGLGRAAVLEAIRRAKALGATRAIVISGQPFYRALGFHQVFAYYPWTKEW